MLRGLGAWPDRFPAPNGADDAPAVVGFESGRRQIVGSRRQPALGSTGRGLAILVALFSAGCALIPDDLLAKAGLEPLTVPIAFAEPEMVTVRPGDTLGKLAQRHGVEVGDLRAWNGIDGDTIEVDQVLLVWKAPPPPARRVAEAPPSGSLSDVMGSGGPVAAPPAGEGRAPMVIPAAAVAPIQGGTPSPQGAGEAPAPAEPRQRVAIEKPLLAGLFGMQVGTDVDLEQAARGMERHDGNAGGASGLRDRNLGSGTGAESLQMKERQLTKVGPAIPDVAVSAPRMSKPAPKRCLSGPAATMSESGKVTSRGLTVPDINAGMGRISRYTVRCFPAGTQGSYSVIFEITVGCNGTVSNVFMVSGGVVPQRVTSCIEQTLRYASFAAHAVPDGVAFQYPMKFTF
jgi:LysM repeat protein